MSGARKTFCVTIRLLAVTSTTSRERRSSVISISVNRRPNDDALVTGRSSITQL